MKRYARHTLEASHGGIEAVRLPPTHGASSVPPERVTRGG